MLSHNKVAHKQKQIENTTNTKIKANGSNYVLQGGLWNPNSFECCNFLVFTSPHLTYKKKITENEKNSRLCFLVYLEILFAHCYCNFHNSMKARNQTNLALDATQRLIQQ
jgi:hypothetical protein